MKQFDIITYMGNMTGYTFTKDKLETIALERGLFEVETFEDLTQRDKDLLLADMLFHLYTTPTETAPITKAHGDFRQEIGSQKITDKRNIYQMMMRLYRRWGDPKAEMVEDAGGTVAWM